MSVLTTWLVASFGILLAFAVLGCVWTFLRHAGAVVGALLAVFLLGALLVAPTIAVLAFGVFAVVGAGLSASGEAAPSR